MSGARIRTRSVVALVNRRNRFDQTPLIDAVIARDLQLVQNLVESGADINAKGLQCWTALHFAVEQEDEIDDELDADNELDTDDELHTDNLEEVSDDEEGSDEQATRSIIAFLIDSGADLEARNSYLETPLLVAALNQDNFGVLAYLLCRGACMNVVDRDSNWVTSYVPLHHIPILDHLASLTLPLRRAISTQFVLASSADFLSVCWGIDGLGGAPHSPL